VPPGASDRSTVKGHALAKMGPVSKFLVVYLDSVDQRLLDYLDKDEELRLDTVRRLRSCTTALLDGSLTPAALPEDWADCSTSHQLSWRRMAPSGWGSWKRRRRS
jgi:hypothetical protein